jgi:hypothetical protein
MNLVNVFKLFFIIVSADNLHVKIGVSLDYFF